MRKLSLFVSAAVVGLQCGVPAHAEPTIAELDQRVRALENTVQTMLELLEAQQNGAVSAVAAPAASSEAASPAVPAGYQMGALYLDVFTMKFSRDEEIAMRGTPVKLPDGPQGVPVGSANVKTPGSFDYGAFVAEPSLAGFKNADAIVGVQWSGFLEIRNPGPHVFSLQLKKEQGRLQSCRSVLRVAGKVVADSLGDYNEGYDEQVDVDQSTEELTTGLYEFSLWTTCSRYPTDAFAIVSTSLAMAAPGDRAPKPISPEQFGVQP